MNTAERMRLICLKARDVEDELICDAVDSVMGEVLRVIENMARATAIRGSFSNILSNIELSEECMGELVRRLRDEGFMVEQGGYVSWDFGVKE